MLAQNLSNFKLEILNSSEFIYLYCNSIKKIKIKREKPYEYVINLTQINKNREKVSDLNLNDRYFLLIDVNIPEEDDSQYEEESIQSKLQKKTERNNDENAWYTKDEEMKGEDDGQYSSNINTSANYAWNFKK